MHSIDEYSHADWVYLMEEFWSIGEALPITNSKLANVTADSENEEAFFGVQKVSWRGSGV